jgi:phage terminase small subunit
LSVLVTPSVSRPSPPAGLSEAAKVLWRRVVGEQESGRFNSGDQVLLEQFVMVSCDLLPAINAAIAEHGPLAVRLQARAMLTKELMALASKLRLNVSSRTRGDVAPKNKTTASPYDSME